MTSSSESQEIYYKRNIERYGDPLGPSIEDLRKGGKSWEEIIESACSAGIRNKMNFKEQSTLKGPFFYNNLMSYYILKDDGSNFNDVDLAINAISVNYDVEVKKRIEIPVDCYFVIADINKKYSICLECHYAIGVIVASENEQSKDVVAEIANYLNKEIFNKKEDIGYTP